MARRAEPGSAPGWGRGQHWESWERGRHTAGCRARGGSPDAARGAGEQSGFAPRASACADDMTLVVLAEDDSCVQKGLERDKDETRGDLSLLGGRQHGKKDAGDRRLVTAWGG